MPAAIGTTLSTTTLNKLYRKVQGPLQKGFQFMCEEWNMMDDLDEYETDWSAREITFPVDINEDVGAASIQEGGYEARDSSPELEEATINWILLNGVFTISKTAKFIDQKNAKAMLVRQLGYQAKKKLQSIMRAYADMFYGFSTGVRALTDTNVTTSTSEQTLTLKHGYGYAGITDPAFITRKFRKGEYVAVFDGGTMLGIGKITDRDLSAGTIGWTPIAAPSASSTDGLMLVGANSLDTTDTGTDLNGGLTGLLDINLSTSLHNISSASAENWSISWSDTASGMFSGTKVRRARDEMHNYGDADLNYLLLDQGVERAWVESERAASRFSSTFGMEQDGSIKFKGLKMAGTQRVPPGMVFGMDKRHLRKGTLISKPDGNASWSDGYKLEGRSAYAFPMDFPCFLVCTNRKAFAYWANQTRS